MQTDSGNRDVTLYSINLFIFFDRNHMVLIYLLYTKVKYVFVSINISTFRFSPSKIFLQLLIPIKFPITTFGPYF